MISPVAQHAQWAETFWARVARNEGDTACWEWTGSRLPSGYGRFYPAWKVGLYAHRVSWEMANGKLIPSGMEILHSCDNPACVRPEHLTVGTHAANMHDMLAKGRGGKTGVPGEQHPNHKLTESDVRAIRAAWAHGGVKQRDLAARYGVTRGLIGFIVRRKAWKHVA